MMLGLPEEPRDGRLRRVSWTVESEWLRVRGIGRERFAGVLEEYLTVGYTVERTESAEPRRPARGRLVKMNPAIPPGASVLPSGSCRRVAGPRSPGAPQGSRGRARTDRLAREIAAHLERTVLTESHATAKVLTPAPTCPAPPGGAGEVTDDPGLTFDSDCPRPESSFRGLPESACRASPRHLYNEGPGGPPAPMTQSAYRYMSDSFRHARRGGPPLRHERLLMWRRDHRPPRAPTRLDRARAIGWRAKNGYLVARVRVRRGGQRKRAIIAGRRPKRKGILG